MKFYQIYKPLIATPFRNDNTYMEFEPCSELKPYIRCFWGTAKPFRPIKADTPVKGLVIPDTCMDIIFDINYSENRISNGFCGINDSTFETDNSNDSEMLISTLGIRFYAWTVVLFSEESMKDVKNTYINAEYYFPRLKNEIEKLLFDITDINERIAIVEKYLLKHIRIERENHIVMETVSEILQNRGNIKIIQLEKEIHTSSRQIERLFKEYVGVSPKQFSSLIRYQYLWNDIVNKRNFNILDEVYQLGYTDQAHLLKDFKRFHTMTPMEAKDFAMKDVVFLQESVV